MIEQNKNMLNTSQSIKVRHGMITDFKVFENRGLEKSRFQNYKNVPLYLFCGMCSFFYVSSKTESVVCSEERTSHTAPPPLVCARLQAV